jgi:hypothetical protein
MQQHTAAIVIVVLLVLLKIYRHACSELQFQKFVKQRLLIKILLMFFIGVILLRTGYSSPERYIFDAFGILLGGALACYSIHTSAFERRNNAWFYRQNLWIGQCIFVLLAGRFIHKGYAEICALLGIATNSQPLRHGPPLAEYTRDPSLTALVFILIAYNIVFSLLLIRKARQLSHPDDR